jgi:aryl-alcohol dehydrogenase-like predicted oxidoreductase
MRYQLLGTSGLRVSEMCLGTMTFGTEWGWGADEAASRAVFDTFVEAGGNFIDTADAYTNGTSERMVGRFTGAERDRYVIATKFTMTKRAELTRSGNSRKHMMRSIDDSLRRLNTDYIDLFYLHFWDFTTSIDEVMRGFDDLVRAGKILHCGLSNTPAWIVSRAQTMAELRAWAPLAAVQIEYSLAERTAERDIIPMAGALDLAVTSWSPLAGGVLSGKYRRGSRGRDDRRLDEGDLNAGQIAVADALRDVAATTMYSPAQIALAWSMRQRTRAQVIPVLGARTTGQLRENLAALEVALDHDVWNTLEEATAVGLGTPHEVLNDERTRWHATGGYAALLDAPIHRRPGHHPWRQAEATAERIG